MKIFSGTKHKLEFFIIRKSHQGFSRSSERRIDIQSHGNECSEIQRERERKTDMIRGVICGRGREGSTEREEDSIWDMALFSEASPATSMAFHMFTAPIFLFFFLLFRHFREKILSLRFDLRTSFLIKGVGLSFVSAKAGRFHFSWENIFSL